MRSFPSSSRIDSDPCFANPPERKDFALIASIIPSGTRVIDIGCGDGTLLEYLIAKAKVDARGMEISQAGVNACVQKGLSVAQGDADTDLADYPDQAFDFAILSQTLQATRNPDAVLAQLLRIGRHAIISFPNFGHWQVRLQLFMTGRMPVTEELPHDWYNTPNIHLCTIRDFIRLCQARGALIERAFQFRGKGSGRQATSIQSLRWANLMAEEALFVLRRR